MKIIIIANDLIGLLAFREKLLIRLKENNKLVIVCPKSSVENENKIKTYGKFYNVNIDRRGLNPIKDFKTYSEYKKIIKNEKPDKVITYTVKCNIYGGIATRKSIDLYVNITGLGTAFVGGFLKKLMILLYKYAIRKKAKYVFFENTENCDVFLQNNIITRDKAIVLKGAGVDLEKFYYCEYPQNEVLNFLFVGRIMKEKGVRELFFAIKKLKENNINCKFTIIGEYEEDYKKEVEALVKQGLVLYAGVVKDVRAYLQKCDCLILPSYHEGMSNAILEACSCGRPVIVSDIPGCREAVSNYQSGLLVKSKSSEDLYNSIVQFCYKSNVERMEMGHNAREIMEKYFDKNIIVGKTISFILK